MDVFAIDVDDIIGAVKLDSRWRFYAGTVGEWILDYLSYDPSASSRSEHPFRDGLLVVGNSNADAFCRAMQPYQLSEADVRALIRLRGGNNFPLGVVVNFDEKLFVNGCSEIPLHEYVPNGWTGVEGNSYDHVPNEVRSLWESITPIDVDSI
jgi:hypothetical protein